MEELTQEDQLERAIAASQDGPVLIFKHSTACPVSAAAFSRFRNWLDGQGDDSPLRTYLIKVIEARPVSNAAAEQLGVRHQSPQAIIVNQGQAVWDASHGGITGDAIGQALAALG